MPSEPGAIVTLISVREPMVTSWVSMPMNENWSTSAPAGTLSV